MHSEILHWKILANLIRCINRWSMVTVLFPLPSLSFGDAPQMCVAATGHVYDSHYSTVDAQLSVEATKFHYFVFRLRKSEFENRKQKS